MATAERRRTLEEAGMGRGPSPNSASELSSPPRSSSPGTPSARLQNGRSNAHHAANSNNMANLSQLGLGLAENEKQNEKQNENQHENQILNRNLNRNPTPNPNPNPNLNLDLNLNLNLADQKPLRKKPGRKPGSTNKPKNNPNNADSAATATNPEAPKVRRPRKPKDPNAPPVQRRKKTTSSDVASLPDMQVASVVARPSSYPSTEATPTYQVPMLASQTGNIEDIQRPLQSFFNAPPPQASPPQPPPPPPPQQIPQQQQQQQHEQPPPPPMRTSGQNYDPIRSNYDPVRETVVMHLPYNSSQGSPSHPRSMNRASASPSISSLVDPPNHALTSPSIAHQSFVNQQQARVHQNESLSMPPSPTLQRSAPAAQGEPCQSPNPPGSAPLPMRKPDHMVPPTGPSTASKKSGPASTSTASAAASPKPPKPKKPEELSLAPPPPLPGSGLMGIGGGGPADGTEFRAPTVILSIPMHGEVNKYINFTRLAEEQYGWDALHPRLAAQRDRLARVAAAGAALERNGSNKDSGDEMSLDSDAEGDGSNVEMGGMSDRQTGTDGGAKKVPRKRKMKEDEYDKEDGFVDDTELLWEEQAAATNDGFFVYSGPLVPEGEKVTVETAPPKRGRGRGSRGGRVAGAGRGRADALRDGAVPVGRNGLPAHGPGSRGGTTTRKPRITKADRARMEQEKLEREKMGSMATMPGNYASMPHLASAPSNLGSTPMVFQQ
ncbi:HPC2-domain-containing protein [Diplocarpon rosae]|nr:HPC2-domain-containing protein [Diplocarpon rosae]